jgi:ABC-type bacteriocin/lantibiotic exporter with double-glycine peptidase domain
MQIKYISTVANPSVSAPRKLLSIIVAVALASLALMFSAILLAVILILAVIIGIYLWWKTRAIRRQLNAHRQQFAKAQNATVQGDSFTDEIIEGEVVRVDQPRVSRNQSDKLST